MFSLPLNNFIFVEIIKNVWICKRICMVYGPMWKKKLLYVRVMSINFTLTFPARLHNNGLLSIPQSRKIFFFSYMRATSYIMHHLFAHILFVTQEKIKHFKNVFAFKLEVNFKNFHSDFCSIISVHILLFVNIRVLFIFRIDYS